MLCHCFFYRKELNFHFQVGEGYEDDVTFENMPYIDPVLLENDKEDVPGSEEPLEGELAFSLFIFNVLRSHFHLSTTS